MPFVTNPHSVALQIGTGPVVEPGESAEVTDEEAESLVAQGWTQGFLEHKGWKEAKGRKADAPEIETASTTDPAETGEQEEKSE